MLASFSNTNIKQNSALKICWFAFLEIQSDFDMLEKELIIKKKKDRIFLTVQ